MNEYQTQDSTPSGDRPTIVGDVVFGDLDSPVAVCTLGSRTLLADLAGRPEIAVAGRVFTENVGIERMIQNLEGLPGVRVLIVCGRETSHRVGETILALHRNGVDAMKRVIGSTAPEPIVPNLTEAQLRGFQQRMQVVDAIGVVDPAEILARAQALAAEPQAAPHTPDLRDSPVTPGGDVRVIVATRAPQSDWEYDPVGYYVVFVDRARDTLRVEQYTQEHHLATVFEGRRSEELCHTILGRDGATVLAHAAYLGRELAKAETALALGLDYEQDRPLRPRPEA